MPHHEYVDGTDLNQHETFAWAPHDVHKVNDPILDADSMGQCAPLAVHGVVIRRGYTEVQDNPGLLVTCHHVLGYYYLG